MRRKGDYTLKHEPRCAGRYNPKHGSFRCICQPRVMSASARAARVFPQPQERGQTK